MENSIKIFLEKHSLKGRVLPAARLKDLKNDFEGILKKGLIDKKLIDIYLKNFSFEEPEEKWDVHSFIILSMARPTHSLGIDMGGRKIKVLIPPTYVDYQKLNARVFNHLKNWMKQEGYRVRVARLPLKLLAVRSGLAKYGKNNISYVGGWGSFHQLFAFFTSLETEQDPWQQMETLQACSTCDLCRENCPTSAIREDMFLLESGRCLTFLNESEDEMPSWVDPAAHNSLIGCMRCQTVCPYNNKVKDWIEYIGELDSAETGKLVYHGISKGQKLDPLVKKKLKSLGVYEFFGDLIPRNLRLLMDSK